MKFQPLSKKKSNHIITIYIRVWVNTDINSSWCTGVACLHLSCTYAKPLKSLQSKKFTLLPSTAFLCTLDSAPRSAIETGLQIGTLDHARFSMLTKQILKILIVLKALHSRGKNAVDPVEEEGYDD